MFKTVKYSVWPTWAIVRPASTEGACVRRDPATGHLYEWVEGGKRVKAKRVYK